MFTEDNTRQAVAERFGQPGMIVEGLRLEQMQAYQRRVSPTQQWWLDFLRRAGSAPMVNLAVVDSYIEQVQESKRTAGAGSFSRLMEAVAPAMRRSRPARRGLVR